MYRETAKLILYRDLGEDSILLKLSGIFEDFELKRAGNAELTTRIYEQMKALLDLSTQYGFDKNLWHNYLTFILLTNENSFSMTSEKVGANDGTVNHFAKGDFAVFKRLFDFDFSPIEEALGIDCFTTVCHYRAIPKKERMYNRNVSEKVQAVSEKIEQAKDENEIFDIITDFYAAYGVGMFGLNRAFRIRHLEDGVEFLPINNTDRVVLSDLIGYEIQKKKLIDNTEAFIKGLPCNNVLLCGDAGTGKSTSIKALLNEYYDRGLRMIEIYKHQFQDLSNIIAQVKNRNYRFIIYMDDLSFEEFEIEYKYLKAVIEGGLERKPDNVLIYATSNRRHLIREQFGDNMEGNIGKPGELHATHGGDLHVSDTVQEKLSLSSRFGVTIYFGSPDKKQFQNIVRTLAERYGITMPEDELLAEANKWELSHGGLSGRTAVQFVDYISAMQ
ncbi:MAG: ATP-binding protein [Lachnospiraceae bacterium]|nr:ATP-binding protein [Lachnospiraceae bacterium]